LLVANAVVDKQAACDDLLADLAGDSLLNYI